tara:strand:- start:302 stop:460 length:159 start_codon:yes stop_codon:yes gene_type:complete
MEKNKKKKKTLSEKAVEWLKGGAKKRKIGKVIGLDRDAANRKAIEDAFGSNF